MKSFPKSLIEQGWRGEIRSRQVRTRYWSHRDNHLYGRLSRVGVCSLILYTPGRQSLSRPTSTVPARAGKRRSPILDASRGRESMSPRTARQPNERSRKIGKILYVYMTNILIFWRPAEACRMIDRLACLPVLPVSCHIGGAVTRRLIVGAHEDR